MSLKGLSAECQCYNVCLTTKFLPKTQYQIQGLYQDIHELFQLSWKYSYLAYNMRLVHFQLRSYSGQKASSVRSTQSSIGKPDWRHWKILRGKKRKNLQSKTENDYWKLMPQRQLQNWLLRNEFNMNTMKVIIQYEEYSMEDRYVEDLMKQRLNVCANKNQVLKILK